MSEAHEIGQTEAAARERSREARLWLKLAAQRRNLGMGARRLLARSTVEMQMLALRGVPDLRLARVRRPSHAPPPWGWGGFAAFRTLPCSPRGRRAGRGRSAGGGSTATHSRDEAPAPRCCSCTGLAARRARWGPPAHRPPISPP